MSGQSKYRDMWANYCKDINGIIFVIDSADKLRFAVVQNELDELMKQTDIKNRPVPIVFFANKMDLPESVSPNELVDILELGNFTDRSWNI